MSTDWTVIEDALQAWIVGASGFPAASCFWANQKGTRPETNFATLSLTVGEALGACDATTDETDLARPAGQEVELTTRGWRHLSLLVQVFTTEVTGNSTAQAVLTRALLRLNRLAVSQSLADAGLGLYDLGVVQSLPVLMGSKYQAHSVVTAQFYLQDTESEFVGYIDTAPVTGTITP